MEIDLNGKTKSDEEVYIELKTGKRKTGIPNIQKFIKLKTKLNEENRNTVFIFFAMEGFTKGAEEALTANGIFYGDKVKFPIIQAK